MKKAKIFLTVLTVLAVVGGALASKAKIQKTLYKCDTVFGVCTIDPVVTTFKTTATSAQGVKFGADDFNDPCIVENGVLTCTTKITTTLPE